jgi:hypothetical protein
VVLANKTRFEQPQITIINSFNNKALARVLQKQGRAAIKKSTELSRWFYR